MATYNPFKKPIGQQLDINDLNELITNSVAEGFYVEYKSDFVDSKKIARSIASFANTYGGWYFIGVKADKQTGGIASNICGFDTSQMQDPMNKALTPVRQNLSHMPRLDHQLIAISHNRAVIAIYVPEGLDTPYITQDGAIYRRAADASDPIVENNRHSIDKLVERGREEKKRFGDFCHDNRAFGKDEQNSPWISVYLQPQPRGLIKLNEITESENIERLIAKTNQNLDFRVGDTVAFNANVPFNAGQSSGLSISLKQIESGLIAHNGLTIELFPDGGCKIHIPIKLVQYPLSQTPSSSTIPFPQMQSKKSLEILTNLIANDLRNAAILKFIDFNHSALILAWTIGFYLDWFKENDSNKLTTIWARVSVRNIWRTVPVVDSDSWASIVEKFGLPVSQHDSLSIPPFEDNAFEIDADHLDSLWSVIPIFVGICLGLPRNEALEMFINGIFSQAKLKDSDTIK